MGISGLLPLLKEIQVSGNIADFKGKRLAVDAYVWLHRGAFGCAEDLVKGKKTTRFVDYAMYRVRMLKYHNISPYVVFDGGPLPAKRGTEETREKSRADNLARAQAFEAQGRWKEARDCYTKCVDITPEMAYQLIKALKAEGISYVVAPYEADAQLRYLEQEGFVDGIITEDSDLLVFGCNTVIFKLEKDGSCVSIDRSRLASVRHLPMQGWSSTDFRRMAMLSGCDYLPSIPGIGLKKAHRMLQRYKTVDKLLQVIRLDGSHNIPRNYLRDFQQAELVFIHQRVFCPQEQRLVPLTRLPDEGLTEDDEKWIGLDVASEVARGIADGDLHPETGLPINDLWPDFHPGPKAGSSKPTGKGTLHAFFPRVKRTKSAPIVTPVGQPKSGATTLSGLQRPGTSVPLARHYSEPSPPPSVIKTSKHFGNNKGKAKEEDLPEIPDRSESLQWEESDLIATQVDDSRGRSPSPEYVPSSPIDERIRSVSPVPSMACRSPSATPARSIYVPDAFTSPFSHVSSPPRGTPPDSLDRALDRDFSSQRAHYDRSSPSPTPASSRVLIAASSQMATGSSGVLYGSSQAATAASSPAATPLPIIKLRSLSSILVPPSSPSIQSHAATKATSSDSQRSDDETPTQRRRVSYGKRTRSDDSDEEDTGKAEIHARSVGQGWSSRWSLGSPVVGKRQAVPLTQSAPRVLGARTLNTTPTASNTTPTPAVKARAVVDVSPLAVTATTRRTSATTTSNPNQNKPPTPASCPAKPLRLASQAHGLSVNALERFRYSRK